jgi:hypothetical protein
MRPILFIGIMRHRGLTVNLPAIVIGLTAVLFAAPCHAAEILYLKSGDRFSGTSRGLSDGTLRWQMPYGGEIRIPLEAVDRIEYPAPSLAGPLPDSEAVPITNEVPPLEVPSAAQGDSGPLIPDGDLPGDEDLETCGPGYLHSLVERFENTQNAAAKQFVVWTKRIELGARFLDGNNDQDFIDVTAKIERENADPYVDADFGGQYGQNRGDRATNRWFGNVTVDFAKERKWIFYLSSKNEYDEFENLDYRGTLSPGIGYRFLNEKDKKLVTRLGPAVTHELFRDPPLRRTTPDLFAELDTRWPLFDRVQYEHKSSIHPSLNDIDVYRIVSNTGILICLDDGEQWNLKLGMRFEHNSQPNVGREKSDYTSSILLVYKRK